MNSCMSYDDTEVCGKGARSHSAQGLPSNNPSPAMKIPLPPRLWLTGKNLHNCLRCECICYDSM